VIDTLSVKLIDRDHPQIVPPVDQIISAIDVNVSTPVGVISATDSDVSAAVRVIPTTDFDVSDNCRGGL